MSGKLCQGVGLGSNFALGVLVSLALHRWGDGSVRTHVAKQVAVAAGMVVGYVLGASRDR